MAQTLTAILNDLLPQVLSQVPEERQTGVALRQLLLAKFPEKFGDYSPQSIQQTLASMAGRPDSNIAKLDGRNGYFLKSASQRSKPEAPDDRGSERRACDEYPHEGSTDKQSEIRASEADGMSHGRDQQDEEKFRSIYLRYAETESRYCMIVDHTRAKKREAGLDKWKYPDLIELSWDAGELTEDGYRLDAALLDVRRSLGEQPFTVTSLELKARVTTSSFREAFFQCVSNSKWAHRTLLAIAEPVSDETLAAELRRLGVSYDVTVASFSLPTGKLSEFPSADNILAMSDGDFDAIANEIEVRTIVAGTTRSSLDWPYVADMRLRTEEFRDVFQWISKCLEIKKALTFDQYRRLLEFHQKTREITSL